MSQHTTAALFHGVWNSGGGFHSALEQLIPLFSSLPSFDELDVHLLSHLLISLLLLLGFSAIDDSLNPSVALCFLFLLHLLLSCFGGSLLLIQKLSLVVRCLACSRSKCLLSRMPVLACHRNQHNLRVVCTLQTIFAHAGCLHLNRHCGRCSARSSFYRHVDVSSSCQ